MPLYEDQVAIFQRRELLRFTGAGARIEIDLQQAAPVRTGELRRSIRVDRSAQGFLWRFNITVAAPQGKFTNDGTGIFAGRGYITPVVAKVMAWQDGSAPGGWITAARVRGQQGTQWWDKVVTLWIDYLRKN